MCCDGRGCEPKQEYDGSCSRSHGSLGEEGDGFSVGVGGTFHHVDGFIYVRRRPLQGDRALG